MTVTCPDSGTLRALVDGEAPPSTGAHVEVCTRCADEFAALRADAERVTSALALLAPPPAAGTATVRDHGQAPQAARDDVAMQRAARERRRSLRATARRVAAVAAALVVGVTVVTTPAGREAAASFLSQFRGERIQVVTIDPYGFRNPLAALHALGDVTMGDNTGVLLHASTLAEAEQQTGIAVRAPSPEVLPEGFGHEPSQILVHSATEVSIAFDEARVRAWLAAQDSDLAVPDGIGGSVLRIDVPAVVALMYRGTNWEELVVGQAGAVTAETQGPLDLDELRAFLLDLPGLDPVTVEQLRGIDDWRTTLPLPVPTGQFDWEDTTVAGVPAVRLRGTSGFGSAVLWQRDGSVHGVGGLVSEDVARRIAEDVAR